jgi:ubiquinone biosynthesis protein COQ9
VLEEVVEARAYEHSSTLSGLDSGTEELLGHAAEESAEHRERLTALIGTLEADSVPFDRIQALVADRYEADEEFDDVLYDQLCSEETAYKFYDDLIAAIESSDAEFSVDRERVLDVLYGIREEEAEGVENVTRLMERK